MAVIPEITCRRCGSKYSGLRNRCPKCGAPRINQPTRVPPTTAAATPQTAANGRAAANIRWQFVFGGVLLLALILAVIVLVNGGGGGLSSKPSSQGGAGTPAYVPPHDAAPGRQRGLDHLRAGPSLPVPYAKHTAAPTGRPYVFAL